MNILVTGANGQLGNEIQLVSKQSKDHYIFTDVCEGYTKLDITNLEDIRKIVQDNKIECIINCAAWTNVDKAESAGEIVELLNAVAPENLAKAMKEVGGLLVHVSTDYVFGGDPYEGYSYWCLWPYKATRRREDSSYWCKPYYSSYCMALQRVWS